MKIIDAVKTYLTDWKNLLAHGIVGVILLYCLLFAPCGMVLESNFVYNCSYFQCCPNEIL